MTTWCEHLTLEAETVRIYNEKEIYTGRYSIKFCPACGAPRPEPKEKKGREKVEHKLREQWKRQKPWMNAEIDIPYRSKADQERIERLFRRIEHLEERIRTRKYLGEDKNFDSMEVSALKYVLSELAKLRIEKNLISINSGT